jgi:protein gp37
MGVTIENRRFVHRAERLRDVPAAVRFVSAEPLLGALEGLELNDIDWFIAGGESGPHHRPVRVEWLRDLRDRCADEQVAFFFKQWGGHRPRSRAEHRALRQLHKDPHARVSLSALDPANIGQVETAALRQLLLREPTFSAQSSHVRPEDA